MTYPAPGPEYQAPHNDRSPWSSPVVLVSIAAGVLLVIAGALAAFLLIPHHDVNPPAAETTATVTAGGAPSPAATTTTTPITTPDITTPVPVHPQPTIAGTDWQGFYDGPRCNAADDAAVAIGQTSRSQIVICQVGSQTGRTYYKGSADGNDVEISYPQQVGDTFHVTNRGVTYVISPQALTIVQGGATLADEPMVAYWTP